MTASTNKTRGDRKAGAGKAPAPNSRKETIYKTISAASASATAGLGFMVLVGWLFNLPLLFSIRPDFIPTAPSTALAIVLSGASLYFHVRRRGGRIAEWFSKISAVAVTCFAFLMLLQFVLGFDLRLERFLAGESGTLRGFPIGRMSPVTATVFVLAGLSLLSLFYLPEERKPLWSIVFSMAAVVLLSGLVTLLGYMIETPLMYGGAVIPMALPTAVSFLLLGSGLLAEIPFIRMAGPVDTTLPANRSSVKRYLPMLFVFLLSVLLSAVAAGIWQKQELKGLQDDFEWKTEGLEIALQRVIDKNLDGLEGVRAFIQASQGVSREEFQVYSKTLLPHYPGLQAVEWVPLVRGHERPRYEASARMEGFRNFRITEKNHLNQVVEAGRRKEYFPVYFVEPFRGNEKALGFDLASEKTRLSAIENARDTGGVTATGRVTLVQEAGTQYGALVFLPVYRQGGRPNTLEDRQRNLIGFVLGVFRINDLTETAFQGIAHSGIKVSLADASGVDGEKPLFENGAESRMHRKGLSKTAEIGMADRRWRLEFHGTGSFGQRAGSTLAILGTGISIGLLFSMYLLMLDRYAAGLHAALAEVKTLSGFIPICAHCKKIRDDKGYWDSVEAYVSAHTEAVFSHGICPECEARVMAEFEKQKDMLRKNRG